MTQIKVTSAGMHSRGIHFQPAMNDGLFTIEDEHAEYLLKTFPKQFEKIEVVKENKEVEKKPRAKRTQKKNTEVSEG